MKSAQQLVTNLNPVPGARQAQNPRQQEAESETAKIINRVFEQLKGIKPAWRLSLPDENAEKIAKKEWIKAFADNGINTIEHLRHGFAKARKDEDRYFPSVGQFMKWCQPGPEDFGLPMVHTAYYEACQNANNPTSAMWTHNAIYAAARATGWFELRSRTEKEVLPLFKRNYEIACRKVMAGEEIVIHKALPGTRQKTLAEKSEEYNAKALAERVEKQGLTGLKGKDALSRIRDMVRAF